MTGNETSDDEPGPSESGSDGDEVGGDPGDARPAAPLEQFQHAALEAVQAARAFLDAAESMIQEPAALEAVVDTVNAIVRQASGAVSGAVSDLATRGRERAHPADRDDPDPGYQSIRIDE